MHSQVKNGHDGLTHFSNVGQSAWAVVLNEFTYGAEKFSNNNDAKKAELNDDSDMVETKLAYIDSGNSSIQIPQS